MKRTAIIGLGVIGASLGMALRAALPNMEVLGADIDSLTVDKAIEMAAISGPLQDGDLSGCQVVFIAVSLRTIPAVLQKIGNKLEPGTIVTDVGSVKSWVMEQYEHYLPAGVTAIGGHPLAGSDRSGITGADQYLLQNAVYVLTPSAKASELEVEKLGALISHTGANVITMTPAEHDRTVCRVSHLPHIAAASLMNALYYHPESLQLAAGGLRDTTRIAGSNPQLWEDILSLNREAVSEEIEVLIAQLQSYQQVIANNDGTGLLDLLQTAQQMRKDLPVGRSSLRSCADIIAIVQDKPGVIGTVGDLLGAADINIHDIQIMGVRDENEGSLRLGVPRSQAGAALAILTNAGIRAWSRD